MLISPEVQKFDELSTAFVITDIAFDTGQCYWNGSFWSFQLQANNQLPLFPGQPITVIGRRGIVLLAILQSSYPVEPVKIKGWQRFFPQNWLPGRKQPLISLSKGQSIPCQLLPESKQPSMVIFNHSHRS